jgi:uridylate kinase
MAAKYSRIMLKLSGEALMGGKHFGIDTETLQRYAAEVAEIVRGGTQVAIVIGGGNIYRGMQAVGDGMDRAQGDHMGMLATVINGLALQNALENVGINIVGLFVSS